MCSEPELSGYHLGQHSYRTFPLLDIALLDGTTEILVRLPTFMSPPMAKTWTEILLLSKDKKMMSRKGHLIPKQNEKVLF